jgi:hypothetical protein
MIEINIDNTGDNVEDLVIQAIKRMIRCISSDHMLPEQLEHLVQLKPVLPGSVAISKYGAAAVTSTQNGMKFSLDLETIHSFLT